TAETLARDKNLLKSQEWQERFRAAGVERWRPFLQRLVAADPDDMKSRLELLDLEHQLDGPEAIQILEQLLESDVPNVFVTSKRSRNRTHFTSYWNLAYRLLRHYERQGQWEKLQAMGLRIARGDKPFQKYDPLFRHQRFENGSTEDINACLSLTIQHAKGPDQLQALSDALKDSHWHGAKAQIARRLTREQKRPVTPDQKVQVARPDRPLGWANLPAGAQAAVSNENVLALAQDDQFVYSGHPWGVAVYDLKGHLVTRIALGDAASSLVCLPGQVWVGSPKGLFRITPKTWEVAHQWLHEDVPPERRYDHGFPGPYAYWFENGVYTLAVEGELLWIGMHRNVQVLNTETLELRSFTYAELKINHWAGFGRIVADGRFVWADSHLGLRRYDNTTEEWSTLDRIRSPEQARLIGYIDEQIYGNVHVNDVLGIRASRIDRFTLTVTPLSLSTRKRQPTTAGAMQYFGKLNGQLVFGNYRPEFVFDTRVGDLKPVPDVVQRLNERLDKFDNERHSDDRLTRAILARDAMLENERVLGQPNPGRWHAITLPESKEIVARNPLLTHPAKVRVIGDHFGNPNGSHPYDDSPDHFRDLEEQEGGLFFATDGKLPQRVSQLPGSQSLSADYVNGVLLTQDQIWLGTALGISVLDSSGMVTEQFTRSEGLCANGVNGGVALEGKLYFAAGWGDSGGGLIEFDPQTSVFTSWHQVDGMETDKLEAISVENGQLKLTYASEYRRGEDNSGFSFRHFPPGRFDPRTRRFTSGGPAHLLKQREAELNSKETPREMLPWLGGYVTQRVTRNGKTYLCGTRGFVIVGADGDKEIPALSMKPLGAKLFQSENAKLLADAKRRQPVMSTVAELKQALQDPNPYYRAEALASTLSFRKNDEYLASIARQVMNPDLRVRSTAIYLITQFPDLKSPAILEVLQQAVNDRDRRLSTLATFELVRRGGQNRSDVRWIKRLFTDDKVPGDIPFGADSSVSVDTGGRALLLAIAPLASADVFEALLKSPPGIEDDDNRTKVFPQLGRALLRDPKAVELLLKVRDSEAPYSLQRDFVRDVFRFTGKEMLPTLHAALQDDSRVVRSNAARACGAICDSSSIAPLIKALDLESGLSRASIVWAFGELRAKEALPALAKLYVDAKNDEKRRGGSGFRGAQQSAVLTAQFENLQNLDAIGVEWNELKAATLEPLVDPLRQEELLKPAHILEAIGKIGAQNAQEFYVSLAADKDGEARREAAEHLADCANDDRPRNILILKNLLADNRFEVRVCAAASLLILGSNEGESVLRQSLTYQQDYGTQQYQIVETIAQLNRVADLTQIQFTREQLEAIAANQLLAGGIREIAKKLLGRLK
ncbi:MAG: hypothetical protein JWM11_5192, partial [Planctomycetaceae bacterium]|nr:hypothetical protein [Planctomycetaceae bacterium]